LFDPRIYPFFVLGTVGLALLAFLAFGLRADLRWIKLLIGVTVMLSVVLTRLSTGVGIFLLAMIFPTYIAIGPTNFVLVVLMFSFWLGRAALGAAPRPARTPCDVPILLLTVSYAISWISVTRAPMNMTQAWYYTQSYIGSVMIFYMTYAAVQQRKDVDTLLRFMQLLAVVVYLSALIEVVFGFAIIGLGRTRGAVYTIGASAVRAGGVFASHDSLADFCSMNLPLHLFLLLRSASRASRIGYGFLAAASLLVMLMTSNRGGFVAFAAGIVYVAVLLRHDLGRARIVAVSTVLATAFVAVDLLLSHLGRTVSVFTRFAGTKFYGLLPETRTAVWPYFKKRLSEHPWFGEGPYYRLYPMEPGELVVWPHNTLAYYWITVGLLGMLSFLALMIQLFVKTWQERARRLGDGWTREVLLILHVMIVVFLIGAQRTDFQRGFVFTYYAFFLFGFAMGLWRLARQGRGA
jgi:O-antigen ligase